MKLGLISRGLLAGSFDFIFIEVKPILCFSISSSFLSNTLPIFFFFGMLIFVMVVIGLTDVPPEGKTSSGLLNLFFIEGVLNGLVVFDMGVGLLVSGSIFRSKIDFFGVSGDFGGCVLVIEVIGVTGAQ